MQDNELVNNSEELNETQSKNYNGAVDTNSMEKGECFFQPLSLAALVKGIPRSPIKA